jgi:hypothetical protein
MEIQFREIEYFRRIKRVDDDFLERLGFIKINENGNANYRSGYDDSDYRIITNWQRAEAFRVFKLNTNMKGFIVACEKGLGNGTDSKRRHIFRDALRTEYSYMELEVKELGINKKITFDEIDDNIKSNCDGSYNILVDKDLVGIEKVFWDYIPLF